MTAVCRSICLYVPYLTISRDRKVFIGSWNVEEGKLWPNLEVERSKVKVTMPLNAVTENQPYLQTGRPIRTSNLVYRWSTMSRITDIRGDLQPDGYGWLFKSPIARSCWGILCRPHHRPHRREQSTAARRSGRFSNTHRTCRSTMPLRELSANDWKATVAT